MNKINILIISSILLGMVVFVAVVIRGLKRVDENMIKEVEESGEKKAGIFVRCKNWFITLFELVIKKIKKGVQILHLHVLRLKRKNSDEVVKAKEELVIDEEIEIEGDTPKENNAKNENDLLENFMAESNDSDKAQIQKERKEAIARNEIKEKKIALFSKQSKNNNNIKQETSSIENINPESDLAKEENINDDDKKQVVDTQSSQRRKNWTKIFRFGKKKSKNIDKIDETETWTLAGSDKTGIDSCDDSQDDSQLDFGEATKEKRTNNNQKEKIEFNKNARKVIGVDIQEQEKSEQPTQKIFTQDIISKVDKDPLREMQVKDRDNFIGVDREILEKKILQKIDKDPTNLDNYKELGILYIKMEKYDDAREVFEYILTVAPRDLVAIKKIKKIKLLKRLKK